MTAIAFSPVTQNKLLENQSGNREIWADSSERNKVLSILD
jgi:hypothetical protein